MQNLIIFPNLQFPVICKVSLKYRRNFALKHLSTLLDKNIKTLSAQSLLISQVDNPALKPLFLSYSKESFIASFPAICLFLHQQIDLYVDQGVKKLKDKLKGPP